MQRKNNILKSSRKGIAMIMAIMVILIISGIMALSLSLTSQSTKRTTDLYLYEQAVLLSKSATEYALLRIARSAPCTVGNFSFQYNGLYNINITPRYIFANGMVPGGCPANTIIIQNPAQNGSVILDVTVSLNDPNITSEPITFFRRSIQKL
jgi:hypothetical protein